MHVYSITNLISGKQYIGAEKRDKPEYFGSGKLIKEAIEEFGEENFKKEIVIDGEYIDNWEECLELESAYILSLNTLDPNGYNITFWTYPIPVEILRKAGSKGGEIGAKRCKELGVGFYNPKTQRENAQKCVEKGVGIFVPGMKSKGGKRAYELGVGIHALENLGKGGKRAYELGVGIHAPEMFGIGSKIGGKRTKELKVGIFASGVASRAGKIAAKKNQESGKAIFAPGIASKGGKNSAHILFETDGLIQQMTLGAIFKL